MRRPALFVLAGLVGALVLVPIAVYASHQFTDVPNTNIFHDDWLADAGVTKGCGGSNYCPKDNVTREQMAAFMRRLSGNDPSVPPSVIANELDGLLHATVAADGSLLAGNAEIAIKADVGEYEVGFARSTEGCIGVATSSGNILGLVPTVMTGTKWSANPNRVSVLIWAAHVSKHADSNFDLIVICP